MQPEDFAFFASLMKRRAGAALRPERAYMIEARLQPVARRWECADVPALARSLRDTGNPALIQDAVEAMVATDSSFYRDPATLSQFREEVLPGLMQARAAQKKLRLWSAGCAAGQEPYSIAMMLDGMQDRLRDWEVEVVATDISHEMVERARAGLFNHFEIQRGLPIRRMVQYFQQVGDRWQVKQELRRRISFQAHNLLDDMGALGRFDAIFCRNVLTGFEEETRADVVRALKRQLEPHGVFIAGSGEAEAHFIPPFHEAGMAAGIFWPGAGEAAQGQRQASQA